MPCDNQFINIVSFYCETVISVTAHFVAMIGSKKPHERNETTTKNNKRANKKENESNRMKISKFNWIMFDEPF